MYKNMSSAKFLATANYLAWNVHCQCTYHPDLLGLFLTIWKHCAYTVPVVHEIHTLKL